MNRYTIYCTPEQTKKALELGAPIEIVPHDYDRKSKYTEIENGALKHPTAEEMIGWLEEQENIIEICIKRIGTWRYEIYIEPHYHEEGGGYSTREKACLAAIDAALDYLIKNKE